MKWLSLLALMVFSVPSLAAIEALQFNSPEGEETYKKMINELRCLVCQNQNLADSDADLAKDLRAQTYTMVQEGKGENEIVDYMVQRYGEFVLYRPRFSATTALLWIGPFLLLIGVLGGVIWKLRQAPKAELSTPEATLKQARSILQKSADKHS